MAEKLARWVAAFLWITLVHSCLQPHSTLTHGRVTALSLQHLPISLSLSLYPARREVSSPRPSGCTVGSCRNSDRSPAANVKSVPSQETDEPINHHPTIRGEHAKAAASAALRFLRYPRLFPDEALLREKKVPCDGLSFSFFIE